jgi:hypothetical protein
MQSSLGELPFAQAVEVWLGVKEPEIAERTFTDYKHYAEPLIDFLGSVICNNIGLGEIRGFQRWRCSLCIHQPNMPLTPSLPESRFRGTAGPVRVKNEINGVLKPLLKEVGTWHEIKRKGFRHLPIPKEDDEGAGVALSREEQKKFLAVAFSEESWLLDAHCLQIMYRTGTGFGELRKLRRQDVDLVKATFRVVIGSKVKPRLRTVALVPSALESMKWLVQRWQQLGGKSGNDYLLPHRTKGFSQPMTSIYRGFLAIKQKCAELHPEMKDKLIGQDVARLRVYDGRVTAASLLLGSEKLSLPTIEKALGWKPNSKMRDRYHRKEIEEKRAALLTLEDAG